MAIFLSVTEKLGSPVIQAPTILRKKICFAIFPDYETGRLAFAALLKTERFIDLTLNQFPRFYTGLLKDSLPDTTSIYAR